MRFLLYGFNDVHMDLCIYICVYIYIWICIWIDMYSESVVFNVFWVGTSKVFGGFRIISQGSR